MTDGNELAGFASYAAAHEGELRRVDALMRGRLGEYLEAQIAIVGRDPGEEGEGETDFTVAVCHVPEAKQFVPWLLCHRVGDEHLPGRAAEQLIHGNDRIELEKHPRRGHRRPAQRDRRARRPHPGGDQGASGRGAGTLRGQRLGELMR